MDTRIELLPTETWTFIKASLCNGTGLTAACAGMNVDIKAMSEFLAKKPGTLDQLKAEVVMGYKNIITMTNNAAADKKLKGFMDGHQALSSFINSVNLWQQHCLSVDITPQAVSEAFYTYRHIQEVATVLGHTKSDFYRYILGDVNLKTYLIQAKFITG